VKLVKIGLGVVVALVVLALIGIQVMKGKAEDRLAKTWPDVKGVDVPVPWPLSESEINALREQKKAELAKNMTDVEIDALFAYLQSLPPTKKGTAPGN
jgi:hypothetical protein